MTIPNWKHERANELGCTVGDLDEWYDYLYKLRESGKTNMFGASIYLEDEFDMDKHFAIRVLVAWGEDFGK